MNIMINTYNIYGIRIAGNKYKKRIDYPSMFQDPYAYRLKDVFLSAYSVGNIYKVSLYLGYGG